jgi:hypothetical protein
MGSPSTILKRAWCAINRLLIWSHAKNRVAGISILITGLILLGLCPFVSADQQLFDRMNYVSMAGFTFSFFGILSLFLTSDAELLEACRNLRSLYILLLFLVLGTGIGLFVWDLIIVPFKNPLEVVGPLTLAKFSPTTNHLRYGVLVSLPTLLLLAAFVVLKPLWRNRISFRADYEVKLSPGFDWKGLYPFLFGVTALTFLLFMVNPLLSLLSAGWTPTHVDILHEGEALTPAYNYEATGGLWTASWFCHGAFFDPLTTDLGWKIFGAETVGASRIIVQILVTLNVLVFGILFVATSLSFIPSSDKFGRLLLLQCMMSAYLFTQDQFQFIDRRDATVFLALSFLCLAIWRGNLLLFFLAGTGSALTYFYSIDRGAYYSAMLVGIILAWVLWPDRDFKQRVAPPVAMLAGTIAGWVAFYVIFGETEFRQFLINTEMFYETKDLFDSYIFKLFDTSALLSIVAISVQCLVLAWCLCAAIANRDFSFKKPWMIQAAFTLLAIFYFRSALGRSDQPHTEYASTFAFIGLCFPVAWVLREAQWPRFNLMVLAYFLFFNLIILFSQFHFNWSNICTVRERFHAFVQIPDSVYLNPDEADGIVELQRIFKNEEGVFALDSQPGLAYLMKKPSLGKNYFAWMCGSLPKRQELIATLETRKPRYIIFDGDGDQGAFDDIRNEVRFPDVRQYVLTHYHELKYVVGWQVYERNSD